jgi:hypothetical protein
MTQRTFLELARFDSWHTYCIAARRSNDRTATTKCKEATMIRISKVTLATTVGLALSGTALAQGPDRNDPGRFQAGQSQTEQPSSGAYQSFQSSEHGRKAQGDMQTLDTNRDQRLDRQEAQTDPELIAAWAEVDVSRDGSVDATEYYLFAANRTIVEMERASGAQGSSSAARGAESSNSAASNSAGNAGNRPEAGGFGAQGQQNQGQNQGQNQSDQGRPGQSQGQGGFQSQLGNQQQSTSPSFDEADLNRDGQISQAELSPAEAGVGFAALDANNDGQIDRQEYSRVEQRTLNN